MDCAADVLCRKINRRYRTVDPDSKRDRDREKEREKDTCLLQDIVLTARMLRTPDSMRGGGVVVGSLRVIAACLSRTSEDWYRCLHDSSDSDRDGDGGVGPRAKRNSSTGEEATGRRMKEEASVSGRGRERGRGAKWLWLVRLCFDRRSRVRVLSLEILGMVLKRTHTQPPSPSMHCEREREGEGDTGSGQVVESGEREEYICSSVQCALHCLFLNSHDIYFSLLLHDIHCPTLHYITLHCTALHCTALPYSNLLYIVCMLIIGTGSESGSGIRAGAGPGSGADIHEWPPLGLLSNIATDPFECSAARAAALSAILGLRTLPMHRSVRTHLKAIIIYVTCSDADKHL